MNIIIKSIHRDGLNYYAFWAIEGKGIDGQGSVSYTAGEEIPEATAMKDNTLEIGLDYIYEQDILVTYQLYDCFRWVPMRGYAIAPKNIIVVDRFKPFIWISFDYTIDVTEAEIDMMEQMFHPPDWDSMLIRRALKEATTTHFKCLNSLN